jgi:hypothetical protein
MLLFLEEHTTAVPLGGQSSELELKTYHFAGWLGRFMSGSQPPQLTVRRLVETICRSTLAGSLE